MNISERKIRAATIAACFNMAAQSEDEVQVERPWLDGWLADQRLPLDEIRVTVRRGKAEVGITIAVETGLPQVWPTAVSRCTPADATDLGIALQRAAALAAQACAT